MKTIFKSLALAVFLAALLVPALPAQAAYPVLSVSREGSGDLVRLTVTNADPYTQVTLYRRQTTQLWTVISNLGQTDGSGYFSQVLSLGSDHTNNPVEQYVLVNGQQSATVQTYPGGYYGGCTYNCGSNFTLSQTSVTVSSGQSLSVWGNNTNNLYVASNSNSSVASYSVAGNQLTVYGLSNGSTNMSVCSSTFSTGCVNLYVNVTGSGTCTYNCGNLNLNSTNVTLQAGQSTTLYSLNNANYTNLYIQNNTNSYVASASASGSNVYINALTAGTTQVTVCGNSSQCVTVYVTVSGGSGGVTFSQNTVSVNAGQSAYVNIYNPYGSSGSFYVSNNTNMNAATASISGNSLFVYGVNNGNTTITVCQNNNSQCGSITAYVSGYGSGSGSLSLYTTSLPTPVAGQYYTHQLQGSGGSAPYYYSVQSGSFPSGLSMSSSGYISGTPQYGGNNSVYVKVTDNYGRVGYGTLNFNMSNYGGTVLGTNIYNNGQLINEGGTVYIVYKNTKTAFGNAVSFTGLGYNWSQVTSGFNSNLQNSGYIVSTSRGAHPWGSWIKSGSTVYFVHELGLIPVADYGTFQNNGGQDYLVVQANSWDFQRPLLSTMTMNDSRLR